MAARYGVGAYGAGLYSAYITHDLTAVLPVGVGLSGTGMQPYRGLKGSLDVVITANLSRTERWRNSSATLSVDVGWQANMVVFYTHSMSGTLNLNVTFGGRSELWANSKGKMDVGIFIDPNAAYIGPFWGGTTKPDPWAERKVNPGVWVPIPQPSVWN